MSDAPAVTGRIGITLLCCYLLAVTARIGGCYAPDPARRDDRIGHGPVIGDEFPDFRLREASGRTITRDDLRGAPAVIVVAPSLDWSPATKAELSDLADALDGRHDLRVAVLMTAAQATPRSLRFGRDHDFPFYYLIDDDGLIEQLGVAGPAPDGTAAALPATFVLDAGGRIRLRDVRQNPRSWLAPEAVVAALVEPH